MTVTRIGLFAGVFNTGVAWGALNDGNPLGSFGVALVFFGVAAAAALLGRRFS